MSEIKKIMLVLPNLNAGGMERVMAELANYFVGNDGLKVYLVLFGKNPKCFYELNSDIIVYSSSKIQKARNSFFQFFSSLYFIRSSANQISPDAVLSFGTQWNNLVLLALLKTSYHVFISDRGSPIRRYKFPQEYFKQWLYAKAEGIIAQTQVSKNILAKRFSKVRIEVIGNPIREIRGEGSKEKIILTVGRLIDTKHHNRLIDIFKQLNAPDWKLVIVGGNSLKQNNLEKLKELVTRQELQDRIILEGERKDVENYYLKSQVFAFTSTIEGFPNVVGEALSSGLPVVSYDCVAGPSEMIIDGENGYLIPVFDDALFVQRLQSLIDDEELRFSMSQKAKVLIERFSIEYIGKKYLEFILS
ncbi:glycosyltransferase family 4 protein [Cyclobacteriaceae bacterium YHN15]|nr:glycosyltransferase family 4 protein [Cyclobacteriaceae bacterium YHN15]